MDNIRDILIVAEFRGQYPNIPLADGVDYDTLVKGDSDPMFVTLPIAEVDSISQNKRYYDAGFVADLGRQISVKRPQGLMGHISETDRYTAFPLPAGHWVGATQEGGTLWGKAYIPPGEIREFFRRMKATGSKVSTSIYGTAKQTWDEVRGAFRVENFNLETLDFAPADRAGVGSLASVPHVTQEMAEEIENLAQETEPEMDKSEVIRELTVDDAASLPASVREAIQSTHPSVGVVSELAAALGVGDADLVDTVRELVSFNREYQANRINEAVVGEVAQLVMADAVTITPRISGLRSMVVELVMAKNPTLETVAEVAKTVAESDGVKAQCEATLVAEMGPNLHRELNTPEGQYQNKTFIIPAREK